MQPRLACLVAVLSVGPLAAQPRWWMDQPVRLIQTNLRETDAGLDAARLARQLLEFGANALLFGMGGIVAYYPTRVEFHYPSPHLRPGGDLFGEMLREAHARGIRVIGRFDLSKTQKPVYDAHPEWFFRRSNGEPVVYNGLYSTCINGGYYHEHGLKILSEALERYEVDGLFFNMFGNQASDYSGNPVGLCHCQSCESKFRARYGHPVPETPDAEYRQFLAESAREAAARIGDLIHRKRPGAAFLTYLQEHVDGIMSESNTSVTRPLPLWPYSASDNVNRARNSQPTRMAFNLCMSFVDYPWRFVTVPPAEIRLRLYQAMAHGGVVALNMHGTMDQEDRSALEAARPIFHWHARHEDLYVGQESAARVLLLGSRGNAYRGFFRLLSEQHIPFAVSDNLDRLAERPRAYDLVIAPEGVPPALEAWVRAGGRLLVAQAVSPAARQAEGLSHGALEAWVRAGGRLLVAQAAQGAPGLPIFGQPLRRWSRLQGYFRIRDHALLPSLKSTNLLLVDGDYLEFPPPEKPLLTLIPPARFGPPEKVWTDKVETDKPGLLVTAYGAGRVAYLPWDVGSLYYRLSSPGHAGLLADLIDQLLPEGRQLRTNAHPLVEMTVMRQGERRRTLVHLVNLSGHSQTAYFDPVEMRDLRVELAGEFNRARSASLERALPVTRAGRYGVFTLPKLDAYDVVILE